MCLFHTTGPGHRVSANHCRPFSTLHLHQEEVDVKGERRGINHREHWQCWGKL